MLWAGCWAEGEPAQVSLRREEGRIQLNAQLKRSAQTTIYNTQHIILCLLLSFDHVGQLNGMFA